MRRICEVAATSVAVSILLWAAGAVAWAAPKASDSARERLDVYAGEIARDQVGALVDLGIDRHEIEVSPVATGRGAKARVRVETVLSGRQVEGLRGQGLELSLRRLRGRTVTQRATARAAEGLEVFRPYAGSGGLKEEFTQVAADNPRITKLVTYGQTVNGQDIVALKVASGRTAREPQAAR